jgi:hypothetical protein
MTMVAFPGGKNDSRQDVFANAKMLASGPWQTGAGALKSVQGSAARCDPMINHGFRLYLF